MRKSPLVAKRCGKKNFFKGRSVTSVNPQWGVLLDKKYCKIPDKDYKRQRRVAPSRLWIRIRGWGTPCSRKTTDWNLKTETLKNIRPPFFFS